MLLGSPIWHSGKPFRNGESTSQPLEKKGDKFLQSRDGGFKSQKERGLRKMPKQGVYRGGILNIFNHDEKWGDD